MTSPRQHEETDPLEQPDENASIPRNASRCAHDLINLVLAARLRVDAARAAMVDEDRFQHLNAIDACLEGVVRIARELRDETPRSST